MLLVRTHRVVPDQPTEDEATTAEVCVHACIVYMCK